MTVVGAVVRPGETILPANVPTLKKVLAAAGGVAVAKDVNGRDLEMLVKFQHGRQVFVINLTAIDGTECGGIVFKPGDRIEVVPWTKSELFRGLKTGTAARLAPVPADTGDINAVYEWYIASDDDPSKKLPDAMKEAKTPYEKALSLKRLARAYSVEPVDSAEGLKKWGQGFIDKYTPLLIQEKVAGQAILSDFDQLKSLHGLEQGTTKVLTIDFSNEVGSKVIRPNERLVRITGNQIKTPPIDNISDDTGLGTLGIIELTRSVDGTETVYLLSTVVIDDKIAFAPAGVLLKNATLLDGDRITLTLPSELPIVKASLVMAQLKKAAK